MGHQFSLPTDAIKYSGQEDANSFYSLRDPALTGLKSFDWGDGGAGVTNDPAKQSMESSGWS